MEGIHKMHVDMRVRIMLYMSGCPHTRTNAGTHTHVTLSLTNVCAPTLEHTSAAIEVSFRQRGGKERAAECCSGRLNPSCRITV